jgi:hypothetical protein
MVEAFEAMTVASERATMTMSASMTLRTPTLGLQTFI